MREYLSTSLLLVGFAFPAQFGIGQNQTSTVPLQPGPPIERTLSAGQLHTYTVNLEKEQSVQLVVDQRGIDVVIRTFSPSGRLGEFDSPNGSNGPENVTIAASVAGHYRLEVTPIDRS